MSNLLANLNEEQLAAVTLPPQHALILAGAGSGKTRVLTTRIAWLISTGQVSPQGILAVTFTNKAAREMGTRIAAMLPISTRGMWIGTFHGLCNRLLRAHHRDAALPQTFQILDTQDQLSAIKRMLKGANVDTERYPPKNLQYFINGAKEEGMRAGDIEIVDDYNRRFVELFEMYDAQCQREGVVDFPELLLRSYELLSRSQVLREHYQHRFSHLLVDEFQDTNNLQYRWLKLLAGDSTAVFAVGDDDQSIYAFRGANVGNMSAFEREFSVRNLIKLEQNYRSCGHILRSANTLIANNAKRLGKDLWTDAGDGEQVRVYESETDGQEAQWLLEEVRSLINDGTSRSDIAILYRSNAQSRVIEHALFSAQIPYRVYGGLRFFERQEVKHALAYMRLLANPDDDTSFVRVVNFPARGIGARTVEMLSDAAARRGSSLFAAHGDLTGNAGNKVAGFIGLIQALQKETAQMGLPDVVEHVIERSGLVEHYQADKDGQDRVENLRELINAATAYLADAGVDRNTPANFGVSQAPADALTVTNSIPAPDTVAAPADSPEAGAESSLGMTPLAGFLSHASLEAGDNQASNGTDALQMMTVHAAKGLEFDAVFLTGLEEGLFPHENSVTELDGLEEERRLMYVAITRARQRLYLSLSQTRMLHGQTRYSMRSRFFEELPPNSLKWLTAKARSSSWKDGYGSARDGAGAAHPVAPRRQSGRSADNGTRFRAGESVKHAKFGEGTIIDIEGQGDDARAQINFGPAGVKWLALGIAKLDKVT
ncbi:MAG: UvrD-helicase domain-containing protein [Burkholderiaceae bacterium]